MIKYFALHAFAGYTQGQQVTDPAIIAAHFPADLIKVLTSGGGTGSGSGGGASTGGTGTAGSGGGSGSSPPSGSVYLTSFVAAPGGGYVVTDSAGDTSTIAIDSLTPTQSSTIATLAGLLNTAGQFVGDVSNAVVSGTLTAAALASSVGSHNAHLLSLDTSLSAISATESNAGTTLAQHTAQLGTHTAQLGTLASGLASAGTIAMAASAGVSTLTTTVTSLNGSLSSISSLASAAGTQAASAVSSVSTLGTSVGTLSSQVSTLSTMVNNSSTGTIQAQVSSLGTTVSAQGSQVAALSTSVTSAVSTAGSASTLANAASSLASSLGTTVSSQGTSLTTLGGSVSTLGTSVSANTTLLSSHSTSLSTLGTQAAAAVSTAGSASTLASSIGTSVTALGGSLSTLGTSVASHTASLTSLGTMASSQGSSLTSLSGSVATAVSTAGSASTLASSLGTTITSLSGSLSTIGSLASAASTSATAAVSTAGSASALASSVSTNVSTLGSTVASHGTSLSTLGTLVAAAKPLTGSSVVGTSAGGTISYALTSTVGSTTSTLTTLAIPPGTLGAGDISRNVLTTPTGGTSALLSAFLGNVRTSFHYGTQNSTTTVQGLLGITTRAGLTSYTNSSGAYPFAFMADYPVSSGDDICVFVPPGNTTATTTVILAQTYTLPVAASGYGGPTGLYTGVDGYSYLYVAGNPANTFTYSQPISDTGGKLAAGSIVLATQGNCIRITNQPSGTVLAAGAVITVGTVPTASMVGKQCFAPQGLKAPRNRANKFPTITAVSGNTITLSSALYVSTTSNGNGGYTDGNSYQQQITGLQPLSVLLIFTPVAEANITSTMSMDDLAFLALCFNARTGDQSTDVAYLSTGDHYQNVPWYLWDVDCSIIGAHSQATYIRTRCSSYAVLSYFPKMTSMFRVGGFSIYTSDPTKTQYAGVYIEGAGETQPTLNNLADIKIRVDVTDISTGGPTQGIRLRHVGGDRIETPAHVGKSLTTLNPSATLAMQNVVYAKVLNAGGQNCGAVILIEGYMEHIILEDVGDVSCASFFDNDLASTVNGIGCLILDMRGCDIDWQIFGLRLAHVESVIIVGNEIQMPNTVRSMLPGRTTAPIISLEGCDAGAVSNVFGGGPSNTDMFQLKARNLDGAPRGTTGIDFSHIRASGPGCCLRIDPYCDGNYIDASTITVNGSTTGAIVDNGRNTYNSGSAAATKLNTAMNLAANQTINAGVSTVAMVVNDDPTGAASGSFVNCAINGVYYVSGWIEVAPSNSSQTVGGANVTSSPAGTLVQMQIYGQNPGLSAPAEVYDTTPDGGVFMFTKRFYAGAGSQIGMSAYAAVPTVVIGAGMTVELVHAT